MILKGDPFESAIAPALQPQNLCELDAAQLQLLKREAMGEVEDSPTDDFLPLLKPQRIVYPDPLIDPEQPLRGYELPVLGSPESSARAVDEVLKLQAAQLKLRLLRRPGMAAWLQKGLDRDPK